MKCFNHTDRDAVGQCQGCGKGLCKECFQQNGGMCNECVHATNSASFEEKYDQLLGDLKHYRSKLYIKLFGGLALGVVIAIAYFILTKNDFKTYWPFGIILMLAPVGFFAMNFNKGGDPNKGYDENIYTIETDYGYVTYQSRGLFMNILLLAWFMLKSMIAMMLGPICFLYLVIKILTTSKHIKKLTEAYVETQKEEDKELKEKQAELKASDDAPAEPTSAEPTPPAPVPTPAPAEPTSAEPAPAPTEPAPAPVAPAPTAPVAPEIPPTPPAPAEPVPTTPAPEPAPTAPAESATPAPAPAPVEQPAPAPAPAPAESVAPTPAEPTAPATPTPPVAPPTPPAPTA